MQFSLRDFEAPDLFVMVKMLNRIGLKTIKEAIPQDKIKDVREKMKDEKLSDDDKKYLSNELGTAIMMDIAIVICENLPSLEADIYKFAGSIAGMKEAEVKKMKMADFVNLIFAIFKKDDFADFFIQASKFAR